MQPPTDQSAVKKMGKYELMEIVGRGAMGEVYKAQDPLIGRLVAVKTITGGLVGRPDLLDRFYQEARSAGTLQHPNIVTVYELGKEGETPFIAMEFLEGESLESVIEHRPVLTLSQKLSHIIPVCRALDFAHKRGVVHRDIKPANVMITKDGRVKVVDFGIARLIDSSMTQTDTIIGTLNYMSPQQIRGERADERSDIWATGVMLYEMLTFQRPFNGANQAALVMNIASDDVEPAPIRTLAPECGPALQALVSKMLSKRVQERYQTMEQVLRDFDPILRKLQQAATAGTSSANESAVKTTYAGPAPIGSPSSSALAQTQISAAPLIAPSRAQAPPSLAQTWNANKTPLLLGCGILAVLIVVSLVFRWSHQMAADHAAATAAAAAVPAAADVLPPEPAHTEPVGPGVIATAAELSKPWSSKEFIFHNEATGESVPAMVVHLPRGGYWGFSLIEPYGRCRLEFVTDLRKLSDTYGFASDHPLIADPCNSTLFDLLRYGGPTNAEVRGDIVHGSSLRPPVAIEIEARGSSVLALKMEE